MNRLLDFYPPLDVTNPETFVAGIVALFARYPAELQAVAIDPARGVRAHLTNNQITDVARIKLVLDELYEPIARRLAREAVAQPLALPPRGPRTPEQQAAVDAQVAALLKRRAPS